MLRNICLSVDFAADNIRLAIWPLYLTLLTVTAAVSVVWILRRQRSSILESQWHAPTPFLEHKSLESTMNDFDEIAFRLPVGDLGKGILDQQSEEVDANELPNNINFSQQLASFECTADAKLTAPHNKLELSAFIEHSKLFDIDFTSSSIGDNSGQIDVNYSAIQQVVKDDLDEIEKDLERGSSCHGLFCNEHNMSEHIEAEPNMTHIVVKNDADMSITDTVHSSLQNVSKSASTNMKVSLNIDLVADKENIARNPYAPAPCESGDELKQVVFDVKTSTLLPDILEEDKDYRQTLLPHSSAETPQSRVLDVNDDLPKPNGGMLNSKCKKSAISGSRAKRKKNKRDENEVPDTVPVHKVVITPKYEHDSGKISDTQTFPINLILPNNNTSPERQQTVLQEDPVNPERSLTVVYEGDTDNISVTQALLSNILPEKAQLDDNKENNEAEKILITPSFSNNIVAIDSKTSRHRTIVYENDTGNISIPQVKQQLKPANSDSEEKSIVHLNTSSKPRSKKRTTPVCNNDESHIFMTESISANIIAKTKNDRKSIVYDEDPPSVYMALVISENNYLLDKLYSAADIKKPEEVKEVKENIINDDIIEEAIKKTETIAYDQVDTDEGDVSMTAAISTNIMEESTNERKTMAYDEADSKSLAISTNVYLLDELYSAADIKKPEEIKEVKMKVFDDDIIEEAINKIKTIAYDHVDTDKGDVSMTGAISTNIMEKSINERKTIAYDEVDTDEWNICMTGAISTNIMVESTNERKTMAHDEADSKSLAISTNVYLLDELCLAAGVKKSEEIKEVKEKVIDDDIIEEATNKIKTIAYDQVDTDEGYVSITGAISTNIMEESINERKTIAYDDVDSKSLAISTNVYLLDKLDSVIDITKPIKSITESNSLHSSECKETQEKVIDYDVFEQDNLKPTEDALHDNHKSTEFVAKNFDSETSMTMGIATVPRLLQTDKIRTVIFGNDNCNIAMNHSTPAESMSDETECTTKTKSSKLTKQNLAANHRSDIIVLQASTTNSKQLTASISDQINLQNPIYRVPTYAKVQKANNSKVAKLRVAPNTLSLPVIPVSAKVMPGHPRGIEKQQVKLITSTTDRTIDEVDEDSLTKESISHITDQTLPRGAYDKSLMAILESDPPSAVIPQDPADNTSTESMFYVMKDSEVAKQTDRKMDNKANPKDEEEQIVHLQRQLSELKTATQNSALPSESFEIDKRNKHVNIKQQSDNSNRHSGLLDLISNFTGNVVCENNVQPISIKVEDQGETTEHKRVSVALNGPSNGLSREDLLKNILMAQELLQKCRLALDDRHCADEDTRDASVGTSNKSYRRSYKVDKPFKFSDESISRASFTCEEKFSPLKKTAFGETSYMYETKEQVIPTNLKDVSDGIKELMLDLVKPVSEIRLIDRDVTRNTTTHSAQIQANLPTSSHEKENTLKPKQSAGLVFDHLNPLNNIMLAPNYSKDGHNCIPRQTDETRCGSGKLLKKISKGINYEAETLTTTPFTMMPEPSTMQDDICVYQKDDRFSEKDDKFSSQYTSTTSGCITVDQSEDAISRHLRNDKVNTIMKMRKNSELLGASLSLELVEDASEDANRALTSDSNKYTNLKVKFSISPHVNINGEAKIVKAAKLSGISIRQRFNSSNSRVSVTNSKTRISSPSTDKHEQYSPSEEVTPKSITKFSKSSKPHKVSAVLSSPDDPTKSLRTEEAFFIFVEQSFPVPVFDPLTPVNNIRHSPTDLTDAHKNDPRKTDQTLFGSASSFNKMSKGDYEVQEALTTTQNTMVLGQHTDNTLTELSNTLHALQVNDESENENRVLTPNNEHSNHRIKSSRSVLVDLEDQAAGSDSTVKITRISLGDQYHRTESRVSREKNGKKQLRIPSTDKYKQDSPSMKVTRKPITKMQKFSTNPKPRIEPRTEMYSVDDFTHGMVPEKDVTEVNNSDAHSSTNCEKKSPGTKDTSVFSVDKPCTPAVLGHPDLVFDMLNPLNNILLAPTYVMDEHKYNPRHTDETLCGSESRFNKISKDNDNEVKTVTTTLYTRMPEQTTTQDDRHYIYKKGAQFYLKYASSTSGSISVEESRDATLKPLRNDEVNTIITKRGNQELLEARSSFALVTDEPVESRILTPDNNEHSTTQYTRKPEPTTMQDDMYLYQKGDHFNLQLTSSTSGSISVKESIGAISTLLRDANVNTMIAMRGNQQLLAAISSLTLDNDETGDNRIMISDNNEYSNHRIKMSRSPPVNIEGQAEKTVNIGKLSEISVEDRFFSFDSSVSVTKSKKRIYIPSTDKHKQFLKFFSVEVTQPQKVTIELFSREDSTQNMAPEKDVTENNDQNAYSSKIRKRTKATKSPRTKKTKPELKK